jgi:hypothetical protein
VHRQIPAYAGEVARWAPSHNGNGNGHARHLPAVDWPDEPFTGVACILTTVADGAGDWLRAGQALQRVLLRAASEGGVAAAFHPQALEVSELREFIRVRFAAGDHPQLMLRLGHAQDQSFNRPQSLSANPGHAS